MVSLSYIYTYDIYLTYPSWCIYICIFFDQTNWWLSRPSSMMTWYNKSDNTETVGGSRFWFSVQSPKNPVKIRLIWIATRWLYWILTGFFERCEKPILKTTGFPFFGDLPDLNVWAKSSKNPDYSITYFTFLQLNQSEIWRECGKDRKDTFSSCFSWANKTGNRDPTAGLACSETKKSSNGNCRYWIFTGFFGLLGDRKPKSRPV